MAGSKWNDPAWTGDKSGIALKGFLTGATFKATVSERNPRPDVLPAINDFNQSVVAATMPLFSWLVVLGALLIPAGMVAVLRVRFPGSRAVLIGMAAMAAGMNWLYCIREHPASTRRCWPLRCWVLPCYSPPPRHSPAT